MVANGRNVERIVSKREKGKIARTEWPAIIARHQGGETLASIARSYACTAPAIRYIVNRDTRAPSGGMLPRSVGGAGSVRHAPVNERQLDAIGLCPVRARCNPRLGGGFTHNESD